MKISKNFRVKEGQKVHLEDWPTNVKHHYRSKQHYRELLQHHVEELSSLQHILYSCKDYALLLIFQGMDASGKDGIIKHVMSGVNPQGCEVFSFKEPSAEELLHDFLWRTTCRMPERGRIGIFNRSYYEEVLVVRVHPNLLHNEGLKETKQIWKERYRSIEEMEQHFYRSNTRILKFFLHVSREEQRQRFLARIDEHEKNWKFSLSDIRERQYWKQYKKAYEECLQATSSQEAPWFIVPADNKDNARLIVSSIILEALKELNLKYPEVTEERRQELKEIRKMLSS